MHEFLRNNRDELIARCKYKVSKRPQRAATEQQLANGVPLFLDQLTRTLKAEEANEGGESMRISGPSGGDSHALSEMGVTAAAHGTELLRLGFSVDQVVHDYGDLCQAITDLAFERDARFSIDEFRTLNRCLDNAIADAVTEFSFQRDATIARAHDAVADAPSADPAEAVLPFRPRSIRAFMLWEQHVIASSRMIACMPRRAFSRASAWPVTL